MTLDRNARRVLLGVAIVVPLLSFLFALTPFGQQIEKDAYDKWFAYRGELDVPSEIVVVAIDTESEQALNERYPWKRSWHTILLRNLAAAGAKVVAFDATFGDEFPEYDAEFMAAIRESGITVLGAKTLSVVRRGAVMRALEEPVGVLRDAPYGIVDISADPLDNVLREYPIVQYYRRGRQQVPQLGVRALQMYLGIPLSDTLRVTPKGWYLGDIFIPRGPRGGMLINYRGFQSHFTRYSYADIVDDAETDLGEWDLDAFEDLKAEGRLEGKMVFIGSTIPEDQDFWPTPFLFEEGVSGASLTPGVEIHAHAVDTILKQRFLRAAPLWANVLLVLLFGLGSIFIAMRRKALWGAAVGLGLGGVMIVGAYLLFTKLSLWVWVATPLVAIALGYTGSTVAFYVIEQREKARIRGMFQQYVPTRVVSELIANPHLLALGGEERELTVLFSDVASFTSISENLSPTELVSLLNEYLTAMTEIVVENEGIIDKYEGDALMAEFGAPVPYEDHALKACLAAIDMQRTLAELRTRWSTEGRPELSARIGINTGVMLVGNMGSLHIMDYTVMGDNVNLASRLEGANKAYGTNICISEWTYDVVMGEIITRELDLIRVKGKRRPVRIFEVLETVDQGIPAGRASMLERFEMGLHMYRERQFEEAIELFNDILELDPDDGPTIRYKTRCEQYLQNPPPADWDGVFIMTTK